MADKKETKKKKTYTTPIGIAKYPWLNKPKTQFKEDGEYCVTLIVPEADAQALIEVINGMVDEAYNEKFNELKDKDRKKLTKHYPFGPEEVEDGENETGNIEFKLKTSATYKSPKTGQIKDAPLKLFDKKGRPLNPETDLIFGGSKIRAAVAPASFWMPSTKQVGVTLYLNAVQVLEFARRDSAAAFGFTPVEDDEEEGGNTPADEGEGDGLAEDF